MWFYIVLLASFVNSFTVIVNKRLLRGVSASTLTWATLVLATPFIFVFSLKDPYPKINAVFLVGIAGSVTFYIFSQIIGFKAMKLEELSKIYPLISLGPIFTLIVAMLPPLLEKPGLLAIFGVVITISGAYLLNVGSAKESLTEPIKILFRSKAALMMLVSVLTISIVVVFDKIAINNTLPKNTTFTLLVENLLVIVSMLPILLLMNQAFIDEIRLNKNLLLVLGVLNAVSTILAFLAVGGGDVGLVATISRLQLVFVLVLSYVFFKDRPKFETLIGTAIMIIGAVLIKIGS